MIQSDQPLPVTRRCELLKVARSTAYCRPGPVSHEDLVLMRLIDEIHLELPFYGSRRIRDELETRGHPVNRKRVQRLMRHMGVAALYPKRRTSAPGRDHKVYPYLLTGVSVERANQVWATDICYLPMAKGFMYLVAVMDWLSRRVLSWRVSNTLDREFCVEALEEALARYGAPEIFNTDQGAQFTSEAFTDVLKAHGTDGCGCEVHGPSLIERERAERQPGTPWIILVCCPASTNQPDSKRGHASPSVRTRAPKHCLPRRRSPLRYP